MQHLDQLNKDFEAVIRIAGAVKDRPTVPQSREPAIRLGKRDSDTPGTEPHPLGGCMGGTNLEIIRERLLITRHPEPCTDAPENVTGNRSTEVSVFRLRSGGTVDAIHLVGKMSNRSEGHANSSQLSMKVRILPPQPKHIYPNR